MTTINVNGKMITVPDGSKISIRNNTVYVNGKEWDGGQLSGVVRVELSGDVQAVETDSSLHVNGNVDGAASAGGSIQCGDVMGHVSAGGSITCGNVGGKVTAGGSVSYER